MFRRQAIGRLSSQIFSNSEAHYSSNLEFPFSQRLRLLISYSQLNAAGEKEVSEDFLFSDDGLHNFSEEVNYKIQGMQREMLERELFSRLLDDCSRLPSATARVSEKVIEVEILQGLHIKFELVLFYL